MRNKGIQMASHEVILILNDDFLADSHLVERHAGWHARHPEKEYTLLGFVEEFTGLEQDFRIKRLDKSFDRIKSLRQLRWEHFYTTNVSLKKRFLIESGQWFSNAFPYPAYEDVEMGYRLSQKGMKLFLDASASGIHYHPMNYQQFARRAYHTGICLSVFYKLHPELRKYLVGRGLISTRAKGLNPLKSIMADLTINDWSRPVIERTARLFSRFQIRPLSEFLYWRLYGHYQRQGVREGLERFLLANAPLPPVSSHAN
jgi:GT2 family glycosyltransferase